MTNDFKARRQELIEKRVRQREDDLDAFGFIRGKDLYVYVGMDYYALKFRPEIFPAPDTIVAHPDPTITLALSMLQVAIDGGMDDVSRTVTYSKLVLATTAVWANEVGMAISPNKWHEPQLRLMLRQMGMKVESYDFEVDGKPAYHNNKHAMGIKRHVRPFVYPSIHEISWVNYRNGVVDSIVPYGGDIR